MRTGAAGAAARANVAVAVTASVSVAPAAVQALVAGAAAWAVAAGRPAAGAAVVVRPAVVGVFVVARFVVARFVVARFVVARFVVARFVVAGEVVVVRVVVGVVVVVGRRAAAVALVAGAIGPAHAGAARGAAVTRAPVVGRGLIVGNVAGTGLVGGVGTGGGVRAEMTAGDAIVGGDAVEDVQVGRRPQPVDPLAGEHAGVLILPGAGVEVGVRGQGLVDWQVAARQPGRAGRLPEHRHPRRVLLRRLPPALCQLRVDGRRDRGGDPLDLGVGLARRGRQLREQEFLGSGAVLVRQLLEDLSDQPGPG